MRHPVRVLELMGDRYYRNSLKFGSQHMMYRERLSNYFFLELEKGCIVPFKLFMFLSELLS